MLDPRNKLAVRREALRTLAKACWENKCSPQPWATSTSQSSQAYGTSTAEVNDPASKPSLSSTGTTLGITSQSALLTSESGVQATNTSLRTTIQTTALPTIDPLSHTQTSTFTEILNTSAPSLPHSPSSHTGLVTGLLGVSLVIMILIVVILTRRRRSTFKRAIGAQFERTSVPIEIHPSRRYSTKTSD